MTERKLGRRVEPGAIHDDYDALIERFTTDPLAQAAYRGNADYDQRFRGGISRGMADEAAMPVIVDAVLAQLAEQHRAALDGTTPFGDITSDGCAEPVWIPATIGRTRGRIGRITTTGVPSPHAGGLEALPRIPHQIALDDYYRTPTMKLAALTDDEWGTVIACVEHHLGGFPHIAANLRRQVGQEGQDQ